MCTKEKVLVVLERNRALYISGEQIASVLHITRNTVWKAIVALRKEGYHITAVTNRGYMLYDSNDILSAQGIAPFLSSEVDATKIFVHNTLPSTNDTAKELALAGAAHGTAVLAEQQTKGRGRFGRVFHSPLQTGIYMSVLLRTNMWQHIPPALITSFTAVAVCEAIEATTELTPRIKWVNDIYLEGKKVCGILTEAVTDLESGSIDWVVVGIGINFSTPTAAFSSELQGIAGSLFPSATPPITRNRLAAEILNRTLAGNTTTIKQSILEEYRQRLFMLGERITVHSPTGKYSAIAQDINEEGHLLVTDDKGQTHTLTAGEISIRPQN